MKSQSSRAYALLSAHPKFFWVAALFLFSVIVALLSIFLDPTRQYDPNRHQYDPETRVVLSGGSGQPEPDALRLPEIPETLVLRSIVAASDIVITGKVVDEGEVRTRPLSLSAPDGVLVTTTFFDIQVRDVWFGNYNEETLTVSILGDSDWGVTKPYPGDELILFLRETQYGEESHYILSSGSEQSMLAINPPNNTIYAFYDDKVMTSFDGRKPNSLKSAIEDAIDSLSAIDLDESESLAFDEYIYRVGLLGETYLNDNDASYVPQTDEEETE